MIRSFQEAPRESGRVWLSPSRGEGMLQEVLTVLCAPQSAGLQRSVHNRRFGRDSPC